MAPVSRGVVPMFNHMVVSEGIRAPFRGMGVVVCGAGPAHALYFACYEKLKGRYEDKTQYKSVVHGKCVCVHACRWLCTFIYYMS